MLIASNGVIEVSEEAIAIPLQRLCKE
jgi:hypothetical protein